MAPDVGLRWSQPHPVWESPKFWAGTHGGFGLGVQTPTPEPLGSSGYQGMVFCFIRHRGERNSAPSSSCTKSRSSFLFFPSAPPLNFHLCLREQGFPTILGKKKLTFCWRNQLDLQEHPVGFFHDFKSSQAQGVPICAIPARTPLSLPPDIP